jgi:hypothetical protein
MLAGRYTRVPLMPPTCSLPPAHRARRQSVDLPSWLPDVHHAEAPAAAGRAGALPQLRGLPGSAQGHQGVRSTVAWPGGGWRRHVGAVRAVHGSNPIHAPAAALIIAW